MIDAVLFDLDDTLFDHRRCARHALRCVHGSRACFAAIDEEEFHQAHAELLEEIHLRVAIGEMDIEEGRRERFRRLFRRAGLEPDEADVAAAAAVYRDSYRQARRPVEGARDLLHALGRRVRIAVVSNNLLAEQEEKLAHCGLAGFVDALVVSEAAGVSKPDPRIFQIALDRLEADAARTVMVGDSWQADVLGALAVGIRPVWFNPRGLPQPPGQARVAELRALVPVRNAIDVILGGAAGEPAAADAHARATNR